MVNDRNAPWVKLKYATDQDPAHFLCERCHTESTVPFPVGADEWNKNIRAFVRSHRRCTPTPEANAHE